MINIEQQTISEKKEWQRCTERLVLGYPVPWPGKQCGRTLVLFSSQLQCTGLAVFCFEDNPLMILLHTTTF